MLVIVQGNEIKVSRQPLVLPLTKKVIAGAKTPTAKVAIATPFK